MKLVKFPDLHHATEALAFISQSHECIIYDNDLQIIDLVLNLLCQELIP